MTIISQMHVDKFDEQGDEIRQERDYRPREKAQN